ncbi:helix-turn-helix transcriptional regulator [Streptomyces qinzhouensis]|uniref:Transcriptional regulator n=1 Tax=Streptomyces qinzhouensis TaxID=2599401 RepID=A0A5B8JIB6_9ACTN|nr:PAS domain-containing protein [Streptomyces qinzhouensis]QDY77263.1 transcriptional regulator [Streptomyces qinzhouensis]
MTGPVPRPRTASPARSVSEPESAPAFTAASGSEDEHLLREAEKIAGAVGRMFPGLCEVVLHDLRDPGHAVRTVENPLSGRRPGDPATELGLARLQDPDFPDVVQNYPNRFPDGRPAKSTSIGIRNSEGAYVAALCLNLDVSALTRITTALNRLTATTEDPPVPETLAPRTLDTLRTAAESRAAAHGLTPRELPPAARRELVRSLRSDGLLDLKNAARSLATLLGVSRATVYNDLRDESGRTPRPDRGQSLRGGR